MSLRPILADAQVFSISVTSTASTAALFGKTPVANSTNTVRLVNEGPNRCYIAVGGSTVAATVPTGTAAATATPVLAGEDVTLDILPGHTYISAICRAGETATLIVQNDEGA